MARITGAKAHKATLKRIRGPAMYREVGKAVLVAADFLKVEAQISITTGAVSGKGHVPSAPGQPPNNDTGDLANKIVARRTGVLTAEVSSESEHGLPLEFGTSKMAERPYMRPAAAKTQDRAQRLVVEGARRVIRGETL